MSDFANFLGVPVTLSAGRVVLHPLQPSDFSELYAALSAPDLWRYIPEARPLAAAEWASRAEPDGAAWRFPRVNRSWVIRDAVTGAVAGTTSFLDVRPAHKGVEVGFTLMASAFHRTGHNRSAKLAILRHAFDDLGVMRVTFKTDARNQVSRRAIARLGAREEGTLRAHILMPDGFRRDSVYFSLLDSEWPMVAAQLATQVEG